MEIKARFNTLLGYTVLVLGTFKFRNNTNQINSRILTKALMSKKIIEFLVHLSYLYYNVIACFYAEICIIYQIYILQQFIAEMRIPARIRSESSSMAKVRSRQRLEVVAKSHTIMNEKLLRQKRSC